MRVPIAADGWRFILPLLLTGGVLFFFGGWVPGVLGILAFLGVAFCLWFFRDFDRATPPDPSAVYSPGDGRVLGVERVAEGERAGWQLIRIFLSVFDVHVQRSPIAGRVSDVAYRKGNFLDARHPASHLENEQNAVTILGEQGTVVVTQIAGLIARRIVCRVKPDDRLTSGARIGLIRFGSQVDLLLPPEAAVHVAVGERVVGGVTVVGRWS